MADAICPCGAVLGESAGSGRPRKFCLTCRPRNTYRQPPKPPKPPQTYICQLPQCGKQFTSTRSKKYCGKRCNNSARYIPGGEVWKNAIVCAGCGQQIPKWANSTEGKSKCPDCRKTAPREHGTRQTKCRCDKCREYKAREQRAHYAKNRDQINNARRGKRKAHGICEYCKDPFTAANKQRYCGLTCAARHKVASSPEEYASPERVSRRPRRPRSKQYKQIVLYTEPLYEQREQEREPERAWVSGQCRICRTWFVASHRSTVTCSPDCRAENKLDKGRRGRSRRRARIRDAYVADVNPRRVFMADGYRCHLCNRKCDPTKTVPHPRAPTVDHVTPLAVGGTHEPANCRTACFACNSHKSSGGGGEQFALDFG